MNSDRRQPRVPISLKVAYRTSGAFLVAYSVNLSKGGIFLETESPLDVGETVSLSFDVPGAGTLDVTGVVAWVRRGSPDGLPDGMGVQFEQHLDQQYGSQIDGMVRNFTGLTVLVVAASPDRLQLLGRYVRAIISCDIVEATTKETAEVAIDEKPDLVIVDLDVRAEVGMRTIQTAKQKAQAAGTSTPVTSSAPMPGTSKLSETDSPTSSGVCVSRKMPPFERLTE